MVETRGGNVAGKMIRSVLSRELAVVPNGDSMLLEEVCVKKQEDGALSSVDERVACGLEP